jgi:hypothetical protein
VRRGVGREVRTGAEPEGAVRYPLTSRQMRRRPTAVAPSAGERSVLQMKGGVGTWEAKNLDELAARLREKYPDAAFERTLRSGRSSAG